MSDVYKKQQNKRQQKMRRARKRDTYSTFVVSETEGCMSKQHKIKKNPLFPEPPKHWFFRMSHTICSFLHFKNACLFRAVARNQKRRRRRKRNTYATFGACGMPGKQQLLKSIKFLILVGGRGNRSNVNNGYKGVSKNSNFD